MNRQSQPTATSFFGFGFDLITLSAEDVDVTVLGAWLGRGVNSCQIIKTTKIAPANKPKSIKICRAFFKRDTSVISR